MNLGAFTFNKTLFRRNLTRFWPLWGLPAILGALFPLALISMQMRGVHTIGAMAGNKVLSMTEFYYEIIWQGVPPVMLIYSILVAMAVWGYLYAPRSVGLMHTLPIRREGLFLTNFLSGMVMLAIPCAVIGAFMVLFSLLIHGFSLGPLLVTILCVAAEGFIYFSTATAAAFLTGNILALPSLYFFFHFLAPLLDALFSLLANNMIFGVRYGYSGAVDWLSPTVYLMKRLSVVREAAGETGSLSQAGWSARNIVSVRLDGAWIIGVYALAAAVLLVIALVLYRRRQSECAGDVIAMGWGKPIFRYGITALAALSGGQLLYVLFSDGFDFTGTYHILPLAVCMLAAGALGYYAASMMLAKSLHVFRGSGRGIALTAAGCLLLCCAMGFDVLGIGRRVPALDQLRSASVYVANNSYEFLAGENDTEIEMVRSLHKAIIEDRAYIQDHQNPPDSALSQEIEEKLAEESEDGTDYAAADDGAYIPETDSADISAVVTEDGTLVPYGTHTYKRDYGYGTITIDYTLKSGITVQRDYYWYLASSRIAQEGTADWAMDQFVNSAEIKQARLRGRSGYRASAVSIYLERGRRDYTLSNRETERFMKAVQQDAAEGTWGTWDWNMDDQDRYAMSVSVEFIRDTETGAKSFDYIQIIVRPEMVHTVQCLRDLGYVTDYDLVTEAQMERIYTERDRILTDIGDRNVTDWEKFDTSHGIGETVPKS